MGFKKLPPGQYKAENALVNLIGKRFQVRFRVHGAKSGRITHTMHSIEEPKMKRQTQKETAAQEASSKHSRAVNDCMTVLHDAKKQIEHLRRGPQGKLTRAMIKALEAEIEFSVRDSEISREAAAALFAGRSLPETDCCTVALPRAPWERDEDF